MIPTYCVTCLIQKVAMLQSCTISHCLYLIIDRISDNDNDSPYISGKWLESKSFLKAVPKVDGKNAICNLQEAKF